MDPNAGMGGMPGGNGMPGGMSGGGMSGGMSGGMPGGMSGNGPAGGPVGGYVPAGDLPSQTMPAPVMPMPAAGGVPAPVAASSKKSSAGSIIVLVVVCLVAAAAVVAAGYFFMQWDDLKKTFDEKVALERSAAEEKQRTEDAASCAEEKKLPLASFYGPEDDGGLTFDYPKTWSVYVAEDGIRGGEYAVYFNASAVSPIDEDSSRFALRFSIVDRKYQDVLKKYSKKCTSSNFTRGDLSGTLFEGELAKNLIGKVFVMQIRNNRTMLLQTDNAKFYGDFDKILESLRRDN